MSSQDTAITVVKPVTINMPSLPTPQEIESINAMCKIAAYSGFVNSTSRDIAVRAADAFFVMMLGRELGIPAMTSLKTIFVIDGKPSCSGQALLSLMRRGGVEIEIPDPATIEDKATVRVKRPGGTWKEYTYTMEMAKDAKLDGKSNWKSFKREMLIWRAVAIANRFETPDISGGLHTIEEIKPDWEFNSEGDLVQGQLAAPPPVAPPAPAKEAPAQPTTPPAAPEPEAPAPVAPPATKPDVAATPNAWADEAKINYILTYAPTKLDGITASDITRYTGIADLKDYAAWNAKYPTSTDAMKALKEAFDTETTAAADAPPAQPKTSRFDKSSHKWTEDEIGALDAAANRFWNAEKAEPLSPKDALEKLGKLFWNEFGDPKIAIAALRTMCIEKVIPIIAHNATYKKGTDKKILYSELSNGILAVRRVGLREYLGKELVEEWAAYVETWEAKTTYTFAEDEMPNLIVTWTLNDGVPTLSAATVLEITF